MTARFENNLKKFLSISDQGLLYLSLICSIIILFNLGYNSDINTSIKLENGLRNAFFLFGIIHLLRFAVILSIRRKRMLIQYGELLLSVYFTFIMMASVAGLSTDYLNFLNPEWIYIGIFSTLLISISKVSLFFDDFYFNPTILFVISFLLLILLGTVLLVFPNSTTDTQISFVDALFTATSAVCVTGLTVFDVSTKFTNFGQTVILILIQLGGLGIMTFTGFFGYFFSGGFSYKNQVMYTELLNENKIGSVIKTLYKIVFITLLFEAIGALFIFFNLPPSFPESFTDRVYFSVFHAVSAFCNAGFSTIQDGLYNPLMRFNYNIHIMLAILIIFGGLGFNIMMNTYDFVKRRILGIYHQTRYNKEFKFRAHELTFTSRIILYSTGILLTGGFILYFLLEYNQGLSEHKTLWGKIVSAFFLSVTPRSAGFSTVNIQTLTAPSIMLTFFLMWVGASPGSNGGGIKNTTFAISFLNIFSIARGKENLELFKRRITKETSIRALAVIILSFIIIGVTLFLLTITDSEKDFKALAFESLSAFAISGLSLGITPELSESGKIILVFAMFIGRIGALTLLIAFVKNTKIKAYRYPSDTVQL